jgi:putative integral membrane protein (TIGR02587 family)
MVAQTTRRPYGESLREYGRGIAGGLIFSLPLFYTEEVWLIALRTSPERLLVGTVGAFLLLLGYNRYTGLRPDHSLSELFIDSVEELGIGLLLAALLLVLLGRITADMPFDLVVRMVMLTGLLAAIGVSVGTAQLGNSDQSEDNADEEAQRSNGLLSHMVLGACGAMLIGGNVAPTGEVETLAATIAPWQAMGLIVFALLISASIGYFSDFAGAAPLDQRPSLLRIAAEVSLTYATTLLVAGALLWFFGRFDADQPTQIVREIVVLSAIGSLGASAGKLLLRQ